MTINEVRADKGSAEIEGGDIIANPYFLQSKQMISSGDSMDFDFDSYGDEEEESGNEDEQDQDLFQKSLAIVNKDIEKENQLAIKDLKKAIDRSKLVLIETQVNDKYGTHRAKRWMNPAAALKDIKKQMKVPKGATLTFISKANKEKRLTEKQFKDHLRKAKPNITLQQYIKNSFIVKVTNNNGLKNNSTKKLDKIVN